jgi:hypothetical protein
MNDIDGIAYKLMIIVGMIMYIFGLIGNLLNIYVFTKWSRLRRRTNEQNDNLQTNNSSLYFLTSSWSNLFLILYPLLTCIIFDGFQYPKSKINKYFSCKFHYYILHTLDLISLTCICLSTIDRYLITSRKVHLRQMSPTKKRTKQILLFFICLYILHNIPIIIYYDTSIIGRCIIYSKLYSYYHIWTFQIFLHGLVPVSILCIFGILTHKQLKINSQRNFKSDKQLFRMVFLLCIVILFSSIPSFIQNIYFVLFINNDQQQTSYTLLFYSISTILFYLHPVLSFSIIYISTSNFRQEIRKLVLWNNHLRRNQVHTININ